MPRTVALFLEYDGTKYVGWQSQQNGPSIQDELNRALSERTGTPVIVMGAGRTDSGVHALAQVCSFQTESALPLSAFREGINVLLPPDIRVTGAADVRPGFHALRSVESKLYLYRTLERGVGSALEHYRAWKLTDPVDLDRMRAAVPALIGTHDFTSFAAADAEPNRIKTVTKITIVRMDGLAAPEIRFEVEGTGFLKQMVRTIVGSLVDVGRGHREPGWIRQVLELRDRQAAGKTAPAWGLYLKEVRYDPSLFISRL